MAIARVTTLTASHPKGWQPAVEAALERASQTLRNITGIEVLSQKAKVENGRITEYRATINITFILDE